MRTVSGRAGSPRPRSPIATVLIGLALTGSAGAQTPPAEPAAGAAQRACDLGCVAAHAERAVQLCVPRIEAEAPSDYEWLYRPVGGVFKQAVPPDTPGSTVALYRGDNIRFLTADDRWVRASYECGFDTGTDKVAFLRVQPGILGKAQAVAFPAGRAAAAPTPTLRPAPAPAASAPPVAAAAPTAAAIVNLKRIGEPSEVAVRQVPEDGRPH